MNKKIGISVYPDKVGVVKTKQYIKSAYDAGFRRLFANLLGVDKTKEGIQKTNDLQECLKLAQSLGMETIVDVNPRVYKDLSLDVLETNFFKKLGATGIRLDEDFKGEVESKLSHNILLELNASAPLDTIKATLEKGGKKENLIACHNFYPLEYTGLDYKIFKKRTKWYKNNGIRTAAFITLPRGQKNNVGPWNVNDGMPTIEEHRNATILEQVRHFYATDLINDIIIAQQHASDMQLREIHNFLNIDTKVTEKEFIEMGASEKYIDYPLNKFNDKLNIVFEIIDNQKLSSIEDFITYKFPHSQRADVNSYSIRSSYSRMTFENVEILPRLSKKGTWQPGDIVILNQDYGRYKGELHIILKEIPNKGMRNYIGKIKEFDNLLLEFVKPGSRFKLVKGSK